MVRHGRFLSKKTRDICQPGWIYSRRVIWTSKNIPPQLPVLHACLGLPFIENWTIRIHGCWIHRGSPWRFEDLGRSYHVWLCWTKKKSSKIIPNCVASYTNPPFCANKIIIWQESGGYKPPLSKGIYQSPTTNTDHTYTCWWLKIFKGSPTILWNNCDPVLGGSFEIIDILPMLNMDRENG